MARRNRTEIEYKNAIYHIIVRGVEGIGIFTDNTDRNKFLQLLQKVVNFHKVHLFSYVLMDTHFHLLLNTEEANLSQAMQLLNSSYAHWFNIRHIRKGHLFQDRYKSHLVLNPSYLYSVASYISLNPVEAGLVDFPEEYPWSSFQYFLSTQNQNKTVPPWLKIDKFLKLCQVSPKNFVNFVKQNKFQKELEHSLNTSTQAKEMLPKNINIVLEKVNKKFGDTNTNKNLRNLVIYFLVKEGYKIKEISNSFHITRQAVLSINKKIEKDLMTNSVSCFWLNNIQNQLLT
jgi:REP element-mobilizing transposase RayT